MDKLISWVKVHTIKSTIAGLAFFSIFIFIFVVFNNKIIFTSLSPEVVVINKSQDVTVTAISKLPQLFGLQARIARQGSNNNVFNGTTEILGKLKLVKIDLNGFTYKNTFKIDFPTSETVQVQLFSFGENITPKPNTYKVVSSVAPMSSQIIIEPPQLRLAVSTREFNLPKDPGDAGKITLEGIDSDGDGLRDDIQREIFFAFPESEKLRKALGDIERYELERIKNGTDALSLKKTVYSLNRRYACLNKILTPNDSFKNILSSIILQNINTSSRFQQGVVAGQNTSMSVESIDEIGKSDCLFDPNLLID